MTRIETEVSKIAKREAIFQVDLLIKLFNIDSILDFASLFLYSLTLMLQDFWVNGLKLQFIVVIFVCWILGHI